MKTLVIQLNHAEAYEPFAAIGITWEVDKKEVAPIVGN